MSVSSLIYAGPFARVTVHQERNPGLYMRGWNRRALDIFDWQIKTYRGGLVTLRGGTRIKRPVWRDDRGVYRIGRTGDMVQMLADLGISDRAL